MIGAGQLDRRIQILRRAAGGNAFGTSDASGSFVVQGDPIWAAKRDLRVSERMGQQGGLSAAGIAATVVTEFIVRWSTAARDVTSKDRILCDGVTYEITGIREGAGRRVALVFEATARTDR
ncbi:head-tail adaptor protein [Jannaschia sp. M317]|uniref:head-tail adaptor protein n=1 Tax=Jannaschia sp. M317 TaxID=2867011 RepID=UPI0021A41272|nr:head-tail adaptor protein [Jannaschia sp. M317]UWQ16153.1 head-tail adaptor protein [Jannaschia sp. M317]